MLRLSLAILGLAAAAPGRSAEAASEVERALAGCKRSATSEGVRFACDGFAASVGDYPGLSAAEAIRIHLGSLKAVGGGETTSTASSLQVGDRSWQGVLFTARRAGGEALLEGRAYALELRPGTTRLVSCGTPPGQPAGGCLAVLPGLATAGPGPWRPAPVEPSFLGKKLSIPRGCRIVNASETSFRIACGELAWLVLTRLPSPESMPGFVDMMREQFLKNVPGAAEGKAHPCRIGGVEARCSVIAVGKGASQVSIHIGAAAAGGVPVSVQCAQHAMVKGVHPVCAGVVTF